MPAYPRKELVDEHEVGTYHCISRCVRRAFLCGRDDYTQINYDYRKDWVSKGIKDLSAAFCIEVGHFGIMSNHIHLQVRLRPDLRSGLSDREILTRWWRLSKARRGLKPDNPPEKSMLRWLANKDYCEEIRRRIGSLSWFMRYLCEPIARRANKEDKVTGRFWEGRFKSIKVLDEAAKVETGIYIDLNPMKAGIVDSPFAPQYTSGFERYCRQASDFLVKLQRKDRDDSGPGPFIDIDEHVYLEELELRAAEFLSNGIGDQDKMIRKCLSAVGSKAAMRKEAERRGRRWLKGVSRAA